MYILLRLGVSTKRSPPNSTRPIPSWPNTYLKPPHPPPLPTPPQHVQHPTLPYLNPTYLNQQLTYPIQTDAIRLRPPLRLTASTLPCHTHHPYPTQFYHTQPTPYPPLPLSTLLALPYPTQPYSYPLRPTLSHPPHPTYPTQLPYPIKLYPTHTYLPTYLPKLPYSTLPHPTPDDSTRPDPPTLFTPLTRNHPTHNTLPFPVRSDPNRPECTLSHPPHSAPPLT